MSVKKVIDGEVVEVEETELDDLAVEETEPEAKPEVKPKEKPADTEEEEEGGDDQPFWLQEEDEEDGQTGQSVPVATHVSVKQKLKGTIKERDAELEKLRKENEELKKHLQRPSVKPRPKRPVLDDFSSTDEFNKALDKYEEELTTYNAELLQKTAEQNTNAKRLQEKIAQSVDAHYERAEKLVTEANINPEVFRQADVNVKKAIDELQPDRGEIIFNHLVNVVGEGSEKAMLYIGRNAKALKEFTGALKDDASGLTAVYQLGQIVERIKNSQAKTSRAPKPATNLKTGGGSASAATLKKKYQEAHKKGEAGTAYKFKKEAKAQGIDVSSW